MSLDSLPVNAFDLVFVAMLIGGLWQGRKHGMSEELLSLLKWLLIVVVCGQYYQPAGDFIASTLRISHLAGFLMAYTTGAVLILAIFGLGKHKLGSKLVGSDIFGHGEYYLGMGSGIIRCGCIVLAALALLNARYFSPEEVRATEKEQTEIYGSDLFPGLHSLQVTVFQKSLAGPWIKSYLGFLLIKPTAPETIAFHQKEANWQPQ